MASTNSWFQTAADVDAFMLTTKGVTNQKKVLKEQLTYLKKKQVTGIIFSVGGKPKTAPELAELLKVKLLELPPLVVDVAT